MIFGNKAVKRVRGPENKKYENGEKLRGDKLNNQVLQECRNQHARERPKI
jgi:hypothetical protein